MLPFFARTFTRREMALGCAVLSLALLLSALPAALRWDELDRLLRTVSPGADPATGQPAAGRPAPAVPGAGL